MLKSMPHRLKTIALVSPLLLLNACAHFNKPEPEPVPECQVVAKPASKFDQLLAFAVDTSKMPPPARAELCRGLVKRQKDTPDSNTLMQILVARTLSDSCGEIGKLLDQATAIPAAAYDDDQLRQFIGLQQEVLRNLQFMSKRLNSLEKKKKKLLGVTDKELTENNPDETRLLREKLDAIRTMEKQLDSGSSEAK